MKKSKLQNNSYFWSLFKNIYDELPETLPKPQKMKFDTTEERMNDSEIIKKFNIEPLPLPQLCANIQQLIEDNQIRTDGWYDIFYGKDEDGGILVLYVGSGGGGWDWICYELAGDGEWAVGGRVFSLATVELSETYCECPKCPQCKKLIKES